MLILPYSESNVNNFRLKFCICVLKNYYKLKATSKNVPTFVIVAAVADFG